MWVGCKGDKREEKYVYVHVADSLCWTAETNRTLQSHYTPIENKR